MLDKTVEEDLEEDGFDWEREILETIAKKESLEEELDDLQSTLDRSADILILVLSGSYRFSFQEYITEPEYQIIDIKDKISLEGSETAAREMAKKEIAEKQNQLEELLLQLDALDEVLVIAVEAENESSEQTVAIIDKREELLEQIAPLKIWLNEFGTVDQILYQRQQNLNNLNKKLADLERELADLERESLAQKKRVVLRVKKSAELVLDIVQIYQTYFLPLLYGFLGATVYILRSLSRDIKTVTYSKHSDISFILRLTLGSLAGLVVGWFIFALPGTTILSSISPLAIAFLVGYNIEILFSLMDKLIDSLSKSEPAE